MSGHASLRARQLWFAAAVTTPESSAHPFGADEANEVLTEGPRLGALDRLEVYRRAYHARLIECLADDYPVLKDALGEAPFEALCRAYIAAHPASEPNLNAFGRRMADFIRGAPASLEGAVGAFAADLAALEWAMVEVIHAPSRAPLTLAGLGEIPLERWAEARLEANSALRLLRFEYPVNLYFQARREGESPEIPAPGRSAVAVYRSGPTIWRMNLSEPMGELLSALVGGETLSSAVERTAATLSEVSEEVAAGRVMVWFREWVSSGLFSGIQF